MKVSASVLLLSAALGVSAHPSGHAHHHKERDFVVARKPVVVTKYVTATAAAVTVIAGEEVAAEEVAATSTSAAAVVATTTSEAAVVASTSAAAAASSSSSSDDDESSSYVEFCASSSSKKKRATTAEIAYVGNTGTEDDYGCNMMLVSSSIASLYNYTATLTNSVAKKQTCACWNKIGPDGNIDGFWSGNEALSFTLPASGSKVVAFEGNTQGGCACSVGDEVATTTLGEFASTWLEFDFENTSNEDWSGADASSLVSASADLDIPALKVCFDGTCSTIYTGGEGDNAFTEGTENENGLGLNISPGDVHLKVTVGE